MPDALTPPPSQPQPPRAPIRLTAQVLTCVVFCLIALLIIFVAGQRPLSAFLGPMAMSDQLLYGLGLSALAALGSYTSFRMTAQSEATRNTITAYGRLDLSGLNPVWISLAAAIGEELLFRAALQPMLGVWLTSAIFLLTHTPVYQFRKLNRATLVQAAGVFGVSVALGFIYQYVGLLAAVMVHAALDVVGLYAVRNALREAHTALRRVGHAIAEHVMLEHLLLSVRPPLRYHSGMNAISLPPFVIGVAGGSGSGKSTVTQQVLASFGADMVSVVMQDDYYRDQSDLSPEVRRQQNYDHPQAFDWPLLVEHVQALRNGEAIEMPEYDFTIDNRSDRTIPVKPAPVIVIEGLFALYDADLCDMMSLKIFVDTAADVRFIRRMQRDITERGRSLESIVGQYLDTVRPMHKQFIEPTKRNADVILPHGANGPAVDVITTKVASVIGQLQRP